MRRFFQVFFALIFLLGGLNHFRDPDFYRPIMPPYLPAPDLLLWLSGIGEVLIGAGILFANTRRIAASVAIAFLVAVLPVHIYMIQEAHGKFANIPASLLWLRLCLQFGLLAWAGYYLNSRARP